MSIKLAALARAHKIPLADVIDRQALALRLVAAGMPVSHAAKYCGVGRQQLHAKLQRVETAVLPSILQNQCGL